MVNCDCYIAILETIQSFAQSAGSVEYTDCASTKGQDALLTCVLDMTLNNMMVSTTLPSLPGPLWLGVVAPDMLLSMGQIELYRVLMLN